MDKKGTGTACNRRGGAPWRRRVAWLLLAGVVTYYATMAALNLAGYFEYREFAMSDTSFFRHFGWRMTEGAVLYTDLWDTKGPMVYLTYYWGYLISPGAAWGVELAVLAYSLAAVFCAYRVLAGVGGRLPAALGVVMLSQTVGFIGWCGTSTESTYALCALGGLSLALAPQGDGGRCGWRWVAAGAMAGLCVLCKANYIGFGCFLFAYWAWAAWKGKRISLFLRRLAAGAAGFLATPGAFALWLGFKGNLADAVDATLLFNMREYHAATPAWADFSALPSPLAGLLALGGSEFQYSKHFVAAYPCMALLLAGSLAVLWWRRRRTGLPCGLVPALVVWMAAEFATGGVKFLIYDHYYSTLCVPVCLLAVAAVRALPRPGGKAGLLALMVAAAVASSGPWGAFRPLGDSPEAAAQTLARQDAQAAGLNPQRRPVAVLGGTNTLHALNRLRMPSHQRYLHNAWMLDYELTPARRAELLRELEAALAQAAADGTFLLAEEPLPSLIARHPELEPLLRGWRPLPSAPGDRVFIYLPPGCAP